MLKGIDLSGQFIFLILELFCFLRTILAGLFNGSALCGLRVVGQRLEQFGIALFSHEGRRVAL